MTNCSAALTALGDPTRRAIFERISRRPAAVGELASEFPVSRPAVSQHLKVLKEAGLVRDLPDGARRIYALDLNGLAAVREYFEQSWQTSLVAFRDAAHRSVNEVR
jgi:DNA-binding transcriptional ArsR family regulator